MAVSVPVAARSVLRKQRAFPAPAGAVLRSRRNLRDAKQGVLRYTLYVSTRNVKEEGSVHRRATTPSFPKPASAADRLSWQADRQQQAKSLEVRFRQKIRREEGQERERPPTSRSTSFQHDRAPQGGQPRPATPGGQGDANGSCRTFLRPKAQSHTAANRSVDGGQETVPE